jgi:ATP-dependent Zn protease
LGGRAAEIVCYGDKDGISTGASGDLDHATRVAQALVCSYGMDDEFGIAVVNGTAGGAISTEIRNIVNKILKEQMQEATRLISENRSKLDALVAEVIAKNHMNGDEINEVLSRA